MFIRSKQEIIEGLENLRKAICGYGPNAPTCDCKYGGSRIAHSEQTGCPEVRVAIGVLTQLSDIEYYNTCRKFGGIHLEAKDGKLVDMGSRPRKYDELVKKARLYALDCAQQAKCNVWLDIEGVETAKEDSKLFLELANALEECQVEQGA